ncbi:MAG: hypothetical protein PWR03_861 [Tenuifilum sp.]|jgi:polyisoprenoid-binding protein YceI|uniref:YceI family protein n=1 Tax=Tenuifilum sp. TaxID=2760880 RepID=UPI0024AB8F49|nr:YceI family protein [Tenuifilum sp.]MDI3526678.1 hypothetical protein [Tenuifilum sp.]
MKYLSILTALLISTAAWSQEFIADVNSSTLKWNAKKVTGEHYGQVKLKEGKLVIRDGMIAGGNFVIDMESITNEDLESPEWNKKLIDHLKSDDFFSVGTYKVALLSNLKSEKFKNNKAKVTAGLTIKGITHPISFEVVKNGNTYSSKITVDRTLYNVRYGSGKFFEGLGDKMIYDEFTIDVKLVVK